MRPSAALLFALVPVALAGCRAHGGATPPEPPPEPATATAPAAPEPPPPPPKWVLLERLDETAEGLPVHRELPADDARRAELEPILARPYLRWVFDRADEARLSALARCPAPAEVCRDRLDHPAYLALVKGGNRPKQGLALRGQGGLEIRKHIFYVEIDPSPRAFATTLPHEYGHVMMFQNLGPGIEHQRGLLPHTTGAITDDVTAFSEGWGIHFETLAGDRREDPELHAWFQRDPFPVDGPPDKGDSLFPAIDLLSYSQSWQRHGCIKRNCFAFLPRPQPHIVAGGKVTERDLVEHWTDTAVDPARVRSLEQMVASEGVVAALFYRLATAPTPAGPPGLDGDPALPDPARYRAFFEAMAKVDGKRLKSTPAVLVFLEALIEQSSVPSERERIARILLELLHYTPVVKNAPDVYAAFHLAGHRLELGSFQKIMVDAAPNLMRAVKHLAAKPAVLATAAAPELWLQHPKMSVGLPGLGFPARPVIFDVNAATHELLMTIPGVDWRLAEAIVKTRSRKGGFRSLNDLREVPGMQNGVLRDVAVMQRAWSAQVRGAASP